MVIVKCINYDEEDPACHVCRLHRINRECVYFYPEDPNDNNECPECLHYNKNDNEWPCSNCYNNTKEEYNKLKHRNGFEFCDEATAERKMKEDVIAIIPGTENTKEAVNHPEPEDEVWKPIENFALYEISSKGRIRNKETGFIKTPGIGKRGYPVVSMRANGKMYLKTVHRLVANAFIPNPENKSEVNHINGIKTDYSIENLEWTTRRENNSHARRTGLHKSDGDKPVSQYEINGRFVATYRSASEASRQTGIGRANICNECHLRKCNGKTFRTAGGYVWKWAI